MRLRPANSFRVFANRCAILGALAVLGLVSTAWAQRFEARLLDEEQGLSSLSITALAQDHAGYLWVGTENGLFEYRSSSFWEYGRAEGFKEPAIYSLLVDSRGVVWAGTHSGLYWLEEHRFHELLYRGRSLHIGMNSMLATTSSGEVIVEDSKGTFSVERDVGSASGSGTSGPSGSGAKNAPGSGTKGASWSIVPYGERHAGFAHFDDMNGIGVNQQDALVVGCEEGICEGTRRLGPSEGVPADYYVSLFRARDGRMWARGRKHILTWRTGDRRVRDLSDGFPTDGMHTVYRRFTEDRMGRILTPSADGFATWDGTRWTETGKTSKGLLHGTSEVFADREGAVWIGTHGGGLLQSLGYGLWSNYGSDDGLASPAVEALARDRAGRIWLGTDQAANLLPARPAGEPGARPGLTPLGRREGALTVQALAPTRDGGMWSGALLGELFHTDAAGRIDAHISLDAYIDALLVDSQGTLWMGTSKGLYQVRASGVGAKGSSPAALQPVAVPGLTGGAVRQLEPDGAGGLWAASSVGLFQVRDGRASQVMVAGQRQDFRAVAAAGGADLWVAGEEGGILRVRVRGDSGARGGEGVSAEVLEAHRRPELLSDRIQFLKRDHTGRLWVGTDHGVNVLADGRVNGLTTEDGLTSNDADAFLEDPDGSVWIGGSMGVSHLLRPDEALIRPPILSAVERLQYQGQDLPDAQGEGAEVEARWNAGALSVFFPARTFRQNHALVYHYRLSGFDERPVTTHASTAHFQKLPPGHYVFHVVAEDPVHHLFSSPATLAFTLTPPWYKSWVMYGVMVGLVFVVINLAWYGSHKLLLSQQVKLERMVAERTRDLEQMALHDPLTGVMNRRAIMARLEEEVEYAHRHGTPLCIALVDLDHFKRINDTLGHLAGDEVLRQSATRLAQSIRTSDAMGRYGGEEFILLFRNVEQKFGLDHCERIRKRLCQEPIHFEQHSLAITCSVGLAWSRERSELTPALVAKADHAMYRAKEKGRNRVECAFELAAAEDRLLVR